jgi:DNA processing protein
VKQNIQKLSDIPKSLLEIKKPPKELYYVGDLSLLNKRLVTIVGTRRPSNYTKTYTAKLAKELSKVGVCIVSGGAMGVDAIAHQNAFPNTIAILANSLDYFYPAINQKLLSNIYKNALALSEYEKEFRARPYSFVHRNRLVVGLGECLIITEADEDSGSLRSAEFALEQGKKIYVLPHRLDESKGTQSLVKQGLAEPIYDIFTFISQFGNIIKNNDELIEYCSNIPSLDDALKRFGNKLYEYELEGRITIKNLKVYVT